jgi:diaminohydroxyphosphoribosylaminopyrimidine deaminase/5-amino-6-(5-phosphoribosylamino)uracil reductase
VRAGEIVGEGWHPRYGGPHAEIEALRSAGLGAAGATMYVTLEPCCHHGKTPPCSDAVVRAGLRRVVVALADPFPEVAGGGIGRLQRAGLQVEVGLMEREARWLNAPYLRLIEDRRPWVIAKWAMTLDGKIATRTGSSQWISGPAARSRVHELRGRVDGIMVGSRTARVDDPRLTARPPGPRTAMRIVVDSRAELSPDSQLARTAREIPVLIAAGPEIPEENRRRLDAAGCEVWVGDESDPAARLRQLLEELGRRRMTNLLVEGGGRLLGQLFDQQAIDEVHVFIANKLAGGADAPTPLEGWGVEQMSQAVELREPTIEQLEGDVHIHGRIANSASPLAPVSP